MLCLAVLIFIYDCYYVSLSVAMEMAFHFRADWYLEQVCVLLARFLTGCFECLWSLVSLATAAAVFPVVLIFTVQRLSLCVAIVEPDVLLLPFSLLLQSL